MQVLKTGNQDREDFSPLVVGAGIGGLTAAIAFARAGYFTTVCERAPEIREIGGAITVRSNATRILKELGILEPLLPYGAALTSASFFTHEDRLIRRWSLPYVGTPTLICRRADIQEILLQQLAQYPHRLLLGYDFNRFEQSEDQVQAFFNNGKTLSAPVLIGSDGIHSCVRKQVVGNEPSAYRGYVQWRFLSKERHPLVCPHEKMEWWGSGLRFGVSPLAKGMAWYISVNSADPEWRGERDIRAYFLRLFRGWPQAILEIISAVVPEKLVWTSTCDRPWTQDWGVGRVTLLGDAAHPFTPDLGLGGALAIEDADELLRCFQEIKSLAPALRAYEGRRKLKAKKIASKSRFTGQLSQWSNPLMVMGRKVALSHYPEGLWKKMLNRVYT